MELIITKRTDENKKRVSKLSELAKAQNVKPMMDVRTLFDTWPGEADDGFEESIDDLRHGKEIKVADYIQTPIDTEKLYEFLKGKKASEILEIKKAVWDRFLEWEAISVENKKCCSGSRENGLCNLVKGSCNKCIVTHILPDKRTICIPMGTALWDKYAVKGKNRDGSRCLPDDEKMKWRAKEAAKILSDNFSSLNSALMQYTFDKNIKIRRV